MWLRRKRMCKFLLNQPMMKTSAHSSRRMSLAPSLRCLTTQRRFLTRKECLKRTTSIQLIHRPILSKQERELSEWSRRTMTMCLERTKEMWLCEITVREITFWKVEEQDIMKRIVVRSSSGRTHLWIRFMRMSDLSQGIGRSLRMNSDWINLLRMHKLTWGDLKRKIRMKKIREKKLLHHVEYKNQGPLMQALN